MRAAILNPIRFYDVQVLPDNITTFPNMDNITYGNKYIYGVNASPSCIRKHIGVMYLQFLITELSSQQINIYQFLSGEFWLIGHVHTVDISPSGWIDTPIHMATLNLSDGIYYLHESHGRTSDIFEIKSTADTDLVKIVYSNTVNKLGCIFTEAGFTEFTAYFKGALKQGSTKNEIVVFENDPSGINKLESAPERTATLTLLGIHYTYADCINHIFSLDTITINGVAYQNPEASEWAAQEGGDTGSITIKLTQSLNDYYYG